MSQQSVVDILVRAKGQGELARLQGRLTELEANVAKLQGKLPKAANGIRAFGRGATVAAGGVRTLGAAVQSALGPIALMGSAITAIGSAFKTLTDQDFAEAKVRTLGVNSEVLRKNLSDLSRELQGQRSVVELTSAAYDVASAGFNDAASATKVLQAASLGATGGFSDLNTVANAATSVLNAYGLSASEAGRLVDQFVQTQNDGKIVVAEYAREIGKVASVAAGLKVPLAEVNAVIAQATASGVKSEVAFTGLKTALAQLASGQATERMKDLGITIDANSIAADGLVGTFKKIKDSGADMGQVLKLLGTEAGPALAPVLNDLERFEKLLNNQKNAAGVAAQAAATAAGTIQGAFTRLSNAVQNLFSDQNELGQALRLTLLAGAVFVEGLAAAFKTLLAPIRAVGSILLGVAKGLGLVGEKSDVIKGMTDLWFEAVNAAGTFADVVVFTGERIGNTIGGLIEKVTGWFSGLWNSITGGVQGVATAIPDAFREAFNRAWQIVQDFWNRLPAWIRGPLEAAGSVAGAVASAIGGAVSSVQGAIANEIKYTLEQSNGAAGSVLGGIPKPQPQPQNNTTSPTSGGGGQTSNVPQLQAELQLKNQLFALDEKIRQAKLAGDEVGQRELERQKILLEGESKLAEIQLSKAGEAEKMLRTQLEELDLKERLAEFDLKGAQLAADKAQQFQDILNKLDRQIELESAGSEEARKQLEFEHQIADWRKEGLITNEKDLEILREKNAELEKAKEKAAEISSEQEQLQELYDGIAGSIVNGIGGAIDAVASGTEDLGKTLEKLGKQILAQVAKMLIFYALAQAFGALAGGATGNPNSFAGALAKGFGFKFRAKGGPVEPGGKYVVGEEGPEILDMSADGSGGYVYNNKQSSAALSKWNNGNNAGGGEGSVDMGVGGRAATDAAPQITINGGVMRMGDTDYIRKDQIPGIIKQASQAGEQRTLRRLQMNPATRRKVGI